MKYDELLQSFGKGEKRKSNTTRGKNCFVYTRVSSKDQLDNSSLGSQLKICKRDAETNGLNIVAYFGGSFESAMTDERKEFQRMVTSAKKSKVDISYILVSSLERFSRNENAIWLAGQLRKLGIQIRSATQPLDATNPAGKFQQSVLFLFGEYDNQLRRLKSIDGMREKLLRGEWVGVAPIGYSYDRSSQSSEKRYEQKIVINQQGKYVRKIFELKAHDHLTNTQIHHAMNKMGFKISMQRLCELLRNPFYCGHLANTLLNGEVVKGKHPALISEEVFLLANDVLKSRKLNTTGYSQNKNTSETPLKQFVICGECGTPFTSYIVKKKNLWYYKCNKIGCKCNRSAKLLHEKFEQTLEYYTVENKYVPPIAEHISELYLDRVGQSANESTSIKAKITEFEQNISIIEERYALGKISDEIYSRTATKMREEKERLEAGLAESFLNLSNPYKSFNSIVEKLGNLRDLWISEGALGKQHLQKLCFPDGIFYDRKIDHYRTPKVNSGILLMDSISNGFEKRRGDRTKRFLDLSPSVALADRLSNPISCLFTLSKEVSNDLSRFLQ